MKYIWTKIVLMIILFFLTGCTKSVKIEQISLVFDGEEVQVSSFDGEFEEGRYISVGENLDKNSYIFDTENNTLNDYEKSSIVPYNKYDIVTDNNTGIVIIYEIEGNKEIINIDFNKVGKIENPNEILIKYEWSNTGRYLLFYEDHSLFSVLVDVEKKLIIEMPIGGFIRLNWSSDDKQAILYSLLNFTTYNKKAESKTFIWDLEKNSQTDIIGNSNEDLNWTPDNKYLYYVTTSNDSEEVGKKTIYYNYKIIRYSLENQVWEEIYKTTKSIENIRFISENEFIYAGQDSNRSKNPFESFSRPYVAYASKVNLTSKKEKEIKLEAFLPKTYFWSSDNKYIFYQDYNSFYKAKVNFDK